MSERRRLSISGSRGRGADAVFRLPSDGAGAGTASRQGGGAELRFASPARWRVRSLAAASLLLLTLALSACTETHAEARRQLRVCADPNNLPFSNEREEGFENRIASLIAEEMDAELSYTWWAQRRGFIRNTLQAGECDLVTGIPSSFELALATRPYYRSTYVFVYRGDSGLDIRSFDDPALRELKIGVQLIGDDYANTPPAHALSSRGMIENLVGYRIYGDYSEESPPAELIDAVIRKEVDLAVAWGPLAGYFARERSADLELVPVSPEIDLPFLPMVYDISMGVRRNDPGLRDEIEGILDRRRSDIDAILAEYGVPRLDAASAGGQP